MNVCDHVQPLPVSTRRRSLYRCDHSEAAAGKRDERNGLAA